MITIDLLRIFDRFKLIALGALLLVGFNSCIQDDIVFDTVDEDLQITNPIDTLGIMDSYQLETRFLNSIGQEETRTIDWSTSDPTIISINADGLISGEAKGTALIRAAVPLEDKIVEDSLLIVVDEETSFDEITARTGTIQTTSSYVLTGTFELKLEEVNLILAVNDDYAASASLPGLYLYLSNNPNSVANAFEVGEVDIFSGAHQYELPQSIGISDYEYLVYYCKPFGVKVGDGTFNN